MIAASGPDVVRVARVPWSVASAVRARLVPHAVAWLVAWPALGVLAGAQALVEHPVMDGLPFTIALAGGVAAAREMLVELAAVGLLGLVCSLALFGAAARASGPASWGVRAVEPAVLGFAILGGVALEYPAALLHPAVAALRPLPAGVATAAVLGLAGAGAWLLGIRAGRRAALATLLAVAAGGGLAWLATLPAAPAATRAGARGVVLLGLDSLSQEDAELTALRDLAARHRGTWYERPVTPGLLTNAVWPAILMHRLPHETGMFFVYQRTDWSRSPYHLVREARAAGLRTVSRFSDQFTTFVGSDGGFDVDASGPRGWKQVVTAAVKDATVLLPVVLPHLPALPGAGTPPNQSGTFAFDLRAEIRAVLTAGADGPTFVAAHLDYLHQARYPGLRDLTASERAAVRAAPVGALRDLSLHWQYPAVDGEPLGLQRWKIHHLERVLGEELTATGFLDAARANRLVLFSDHGDRSGADLRNFGAPRYHRVLFVTFGVPARDAAAPISLLETGPLLGFPDPSRPEPAPAVVEYTNVVGDEWPRLLRAGRAHPSGDVDLEPDILRAIGRRLRAIEPWGAMTLLRPTPASPAGNG